MFQKPSSGRAEGQRTLKNSSEVDESTPVSNDEAFIEEAIEQVDSLESQHQIIEDTSFIGEINEDHMSQESKQGIFI